MPTDRSCMPVDAHESGILILCLSDGMSHELIGSLKLGIVWVFVQLIFSPHWTMNQMNINPIID